MQKRCWLVSYHVVSCRTVSFHFVSYHIISYNVKSCQVMSCHMIIIIFMLLLLLLLIRSQFVLVTRRMLFEIFKPPSTNCFLLSGKGSFLKGELSRDFSAWTTLEESEHTSPSPGFFWGFFLGGTICIHVYRFVGNWVVGLYKVGPKNDRYKWGERTPVMAL